MSKLSNRRSASVRVELDREFDSQADAIFNDPFLQSQLTGRYIAVFADAATRDVVKSFEREPGLKVASSSDFGARIVPTPTDATYAMHFEALGIAIVNAPHDQVYRLRAASSGGLRIVPERFVYASGILQVDEEYLAGFRDGVNATVERVLTTKASCMKEPKHRTVEGFRFQAAEQASTWNLLRTGATNSRFLGRGIKVAILDTGYDENHPDFVGRSIVSQSFVAGESVQDVHGHGTHCLGTACGSRKPSSQGPFYGCASEAEILVGKVLANSGQGDEGAILNGINWALENGADIVSMSIEGAFHPPNPDLPQYEAAGARALANGRLLIAAAGNFSVRPFFTRPLAFPASASTVMAVAAIAPDDSVASFSCVGGSNGKVDIAAPGVAIESSFPLPRTRKVDSGTSMAAPLVAGIAAMYCESDPLLRGQALWNKMIQTAVRLPAGSEDVGAGCVQGP